MNARLSYVPSSERWSVAVWGNNITDEEYFDDVVANPAGVRGSYGDVPTYGVDLTMKF